MMKSKTVKAFNDLFDALMEEYPEGEGLSEEVQLAVILSLQKTIERLGLYISEDGTIKDTESVAL